ncbi:MAG: FtsX-like permease family protein [Acidobacteria bacterium]|nr:FtsX-like permease family protein [Acidobacteriota bacterium]
MFKHICKLVWNRKRVNFLIILEIFISFLVMFSVIVLTVYYADNYRQPLGFDYQNVWYLQVEAIEKSGTAEKQDRPQQIEKFKRVMAAVREFGEVEAVAGAQYLPYMNGNWSSCNDVNGKPVCYWANAVTDDYRDVMRINIVRGRWFGKEDDGANYKPLIINRQLAKERFGNEDPIGKALNQLDKQDSLPEGKRARVEERVVGMVDDFRKNGEFAELKGYAIYRNSLREADDRLPRVLGVRVHPGVTAAFEEKLLKRLQNEASDWSFTIKPLTQMREEMHQQSIVPLTAFAVVAGFLMLMVGLGLIGVLWQSVTQRTKEIGLRRAKGATKQRIYRQILGELLVITTCGALIGTLVVVQFPLLDFLGFATPKVYAYAIVISLLLIYALTAVCGLYPSWLATKVHPAEALHYE